MASVFEVMARLTGDASGMVTAFRKASAEADKMRKNIKDRSDKIKSEMESLAMPAGVVAGGLLISAKKIGDWAADAEQNVGAVETVFKQYADTVKKRSEEASTAVGLSKSEYQSFSTLVGSQLKNLGTPFEQVADKSDNLIKKGADLASMFGGTTTNAIEAISSALKGEMDPIEKYGITLNQATLEAIALKNGLVSATVDSGKVTEASLKMEAAQQKYNEAVRKYGEDSAQAKNAQAGLLAAETRLDKAKAGKIPKLDAETKALAVQMAITEQSKDATGNFAREVDTTAHKQQVATAKFRDAATTIGTSLLPAFSFLADMVARVSQFMAENQNIVLLFGGVALVASGGILGIVAAMKLWEMWTKAVNIANLILNKTMKANVIFIVVAALAALVAGLMWAYNNVEWFRKGVDFAWNAIKTAMKVVGDWMSNTLWPIIKAVLDGLGFAFSWFYNNVIKPVWTGIKAAIWVNWQYIKLIFDTIKWAVEKFLAPVMRWFYDNVIKPVWGKISGFIKNVWNNGVKPIWEKFANFISDHVAPKVEKGVGAIKTAWNAVKNAALKPVNFVIETVINKGIVGTFNKIAKAVGSDAKLTPLTPIGGSKGGGSGRAVQARAKGGYTPAGMTLVGEQGPELVDFKQPSRVYTAKDSAALMNKAKSMNGQQMQSALATDAPNNVMPSGGWISNLAGGAWEGIKAAGSWVADRAADVTRWAAQGFSAAMKHVILPIYDGMTSGFGNNGGIPQMAKDGGRSVLGKALSFAESFDKEQAKRQAADGGAQYIDGKLGRLFRPASGGITSGFGASRGAYPHAGIDFAVPIGSPVRSFFDGVVRRVGWNTVTGRTGKGMVIDHAQGMSSYYGHLSQWIAKAGQKIKGGDIVARSGNTGRSTGPHLHAELWRNGTPFNYRSLLRDNGGVLPQGTSVVTNNTGKDEMVLTSQQWQLAKQSLLGGFASPIQVFVSLNGVDVNDKSTLKKTGELIGEQVMEAVKRAQRGGVYN